MKIADTTNRRLPHKIHLTCVLRLIARPFRRTVLLDTNLGPRRQSAAAETSVIIGNWLEKQAARRSRPGIGTAFFSRPCPRQPVLTPLARILFAPMLRLRPRSPRPCHPIPPPPISGASFACPTDSVAQAFGSGSNFASCASQLAEVVTRPPPPLA